MEKNKKFKEIIDSYKPTQIKRKGLDQDLAKLNNKQFFWFCVMNSGTKVDDVFEKAKQINPNNIKQKDLTHWMKREYAIKIQGIIQHKYKNNHANIWNNKPSSFELIKRFMEFPRVGPKIASMTANLLQRVRKVNLSDKLCIDISPDVLVMRVFSRVFSISEKQYLIQLKAREISPKFPGSLDFKVWCIGGEFCSKERPKCSNCPLNCICDYGDVKNMLSPEEARDKLDEYLDQIPNQRSDYTSKKYKEFNDIKWE